MEVKRGRETLNLQQLSPNEYFNLRHGDIVHGSDGRRWRVTSVKRWATRPADLDIGLKHGLRSYDSQSIRGMQPVGGPLYKESGVHFSAMPPVKVAGVSFHTGQRVIAKEPLEWAGRKVAPGTTGMIVEIRPLAPAQSQFHGGQRAFLEVSFSKGGIFRNVFPNQVQPKEVSETSFSKIERSSELTKAQPWRLTPKRVRPHTRKLATPSTIRTK